MSDPLASFRAALRTAGTSPVDVICLGDSITEGMVAPHREDAWPQRLRDLLRAACFSGSTAGGTGYCPSYSVSSSVGDFWQKAGPVEISTLQTGLGCRALKAPNGASVALGFTGTGIEFLFSAGPDACFTFTVDGGAPTTVDARQPAIASGHSIGVYGLCDQAHTLTISGTTQGSAYVEGALIHRGDEAMGVRMWESGHSGFTCDDYNATDRWHGSFQTVPNPKLVTVCLGANEYNRAMTSAQYGRGLDTLLSTVRGLLSGHDCSVVVVSPHARVPLPGRAPQSVYEAMAATTAAAHGAAYLSMSPVIGPIADAIAAGIVQPGKGIHPAKEGHRLYANAVANLVLPSDASAQSGRKDGCGAP